MSPVDQFCNQPAFAEHLYQNWYIACTTHELDSRRQAAPIARVVLDIPLVLFRGQNGEPVALLDRCPHRNVPLSQGRLVAKNGKVRLVCRYHGWHFDPQGKCCKVPGSCNFKRESRCDAIAYPAMERQGFVWVYPAGQVDNASQPYSFPNLSAPGYASFRWQMQANVSTANAAENLLDATHTHFVHSGLIRTQQKRQLVTVTITRSDRSAEAIYTGEQQLSGLIANLLAPGCKEITSIGRFLRPSIAQLEYKTNKNYRLLLTAFITPENTRQVRAYTVVTFKSGLPSWLGRWLGYLLAKPLFYWAMRQDLSILHAQADNIKRFGGERFVYTELDVLRPHIEQLLRSPPAKKATEKTDGANAVQFEHTVQMEL